MSAHLDEEAQMAAIAAWWRKNGRSVIFTVILSFIGLCTWQYWQHQHGLKMHAASVDYQELLIATDSKDILAKADKMIAAYDGNMYGVVARLKKAQQLVIAKDYAQASKLFHDIIDHSSAPLFRQLARIRLARILIFQHKIDAALAILSVQDEPILRSWVYWLQADCYQAKGNNDQAVQFYQKAREAFTERSLASSLITMKLANMTSEINKASTGAEHE